MEAAGTRTIVKTYKYKLYRNKKLRHLNQLIELHSEVYNYCIALHKRYYKMYHKYLPANELKKHLTKVKKRADKARWNELGSQSIQDVVERIDRSYKAFFKAKKEHRRGRHGAPRFKKRTKYTSFTLKQAGYQFHDDNHITILGKDYKYVAHRPFVGTVKTVTVKRDACGDFWLCVVCSQEVPDLVPRKGEAIGYDFGLKTFLTGSDGSRIESPRFFEANASRLRSAQQELSRKKSGSNNRGRARLAVARTHRNTKNRRTDWSFKTAYRISQNYTDVCVEDLNMDGMKRLWGRKVSDYSFSEFVNILDYELRKTGGRLHMVDRFFPSSKTCSHCGHVVDDLPLSVREWDCPSCHHHLDRDINAAINILTEGMRTNCVA